MTKAELRRIYLERRKTLTIAERKQKSERIARRFFENFDLSRIRFLHCFLSIERFNEIDTRLILEKIWRDFPHIRTLVPRVNARTGELEHLSFDPETVLIKNAWQIAEPAGDEPVAAAAVDLVIVPLLCFDLEGFRVGYGKAYYDKFLKVCRPDCKKIGLSFFAPETRISGVEAHDERLDACITPEKIYHFDEA